MFKNLIISENTPVITVLERFDNVEGSVFILNSDEHGFVGYILDNVLRSLALDLDNLTKPIGMFTLNNFYVVDKKEKEYSSVNLSNYSLIIEKSGNYLSRIYGPVLSYVEDFDISDVPVVVMAGGFGKRLRPVTNIIPKPLLPVGDKTVLEVIMERFFRYGILDFFLTLNYKANYIKAYFQGLSPDYRLHYIVEEKPLGTAGSLKFIQDHVDRPFFVSNCDTLINTSYRKIYDFHLKNRFDLTIVGAVQKVQIPFGICEVDKDFTLIQMKEKPASYHIINTGVYVVNPQILDIIPYNEYYDITDFINDIQRSGGKVGVYPIAEGSWINLGSMSDFKNNMDKLL